MNTTPNKKTLWQIIIMGEMFKNISCENNAGYDKILQENAFKY